MAFSLIQAGTTLQLVDSFGVITSLTLPSNVTLDSSVPPRFVIYNNYIFLVNTPNIPLTIDQLGTVRTITPKAPQIAPIVAAGSAGSLSGTYNGIRVTFVIKDADGNTISESDFSPASNSVTITSANILVSGIPTSQETISARRLYRPTNGGAVLFPWLDVDGNTITTIQDDLADAGLELLAAPTLGNPPRLTLIKEWRNLLWGVGDIDIDTLVFSQPDAFYSWPATNNLLVPGAGKDKFGIISLIPRREALGIGRRDIMWQVTGENATDGFSVVKLSENTGIESNETARVYRDIGFWLWKDGVYQWDGNGINNISDEGGVSSWFNTNFYFNRGLFYKAFAEIDVNRLRYRLFLASAGSTRIDRWVEYDLTSKKWWGPHVTDEFLPSSSFHLPDSKDIIELVVGSTNGFIWEDQNIPTDGTSTPIIMDVDTKFYDANSADLEKYFGELSMIGKVQPSGLLRITPRVGYMSTEDKPVLPYDMTKGRQRLSRIGTGKNFQLNFKHDVAGEKVEIYGFQLPYNIIGRR